MIRYAEVERFNVVDTIFRGTEVYVLDKSDASTQTVNHLSYEAVLKMLSNTDRRYYFWKTEEVKENTEEPQEVLK